jgi:hypothetical protein
VQAIEVLAAMFAKRQTPHAYAVSDVRAGFVHGE